jgi:uncharacterized protein
MTQKSTIMNFTLGVKEALMRVLVTGATGFVGSAVVALLTSSGDEVIPVSRKPGLTHNSITWDPAAGKLDPAALEGMDAVVHLAGENIAAARWTPAEKARIRDSRVQGTRLLAESLGRLSRRPKVMVSASAVGFYGSRGEQLLDETSSAGTGFLAEVCLDWEAAAKPVAAAGIRVVHLRIGMVLSPEGGALAKMLTPFQMGVGGIIGDGQQYMSWIALNDLAAVIRHAIVTETLSGPVNAVAPQAVTNRQFTKTLGHVLGRPTIFPMPAFAARLAFGEMADALLLCSSRVVPRRLIASRYEFRHPELEAALRFLLGKQTRTATA